MLLVLTNTGDATADYLLERLSEATVHFVRLDTDTALRRITLSYTPGNPQLEIDGKWYKPDDFSTVWYRRPEKLTLCGPDSTRPEDECVRDEWSEALEGFFSHIPRSKWMNYPAANALASRKLEQLSTACRIGFTIPETIVTQNPDVLRSFFHSNKGQIIVKPMGRAYIERPDEQSDSIIFTNRVQESELDNLSDLCGCPTLFQQAVAKSSDVRITVVDSAMHAFELLAHDPSGRQRCDIRRNNMQDVEYRAVNLPVQIADAVQQLMSYYELRFAAIDMAIAENGEWYFFEVNPNGQWAWLDICGASEIYKSFCDSFSMATI